MFDFDLTDELKIKIRKIARKDKKKAKIIDRKIKEVINSDSISIEHYKNLRYDLSKYKRVHIDRSFVLTFKVDIRDNFILFVDFDHHDNIFKRRK